MKINTEPVKITGRVLPPETIHQGQKKSVSSRNLSASFRFELKISVDTVV